MDLPLKVDFSGKVVVVTGVVLPIDAGFSAYSGV